MVIRKKGDLPVILIFIDWYKPAYKAGGPIVAAVNFVDQMKGRYAIFICTGSSDLGESRPLDNIKTDIWQQEEDNVQVFYGSNILSYKHIREQINRIAPDFIYLHSIFSLVFTLYPMLVLRYSKCKIKIILAPRGMLRGSAIANKSIKKKLFIALFRKFLLHRSLVFHATDETERADIRSYFGHRNRVFVIPDFGAVQSGFAGVIEKECGRLKILFLGRIHPIKNLYFLLQVLQKTRTEIGLTVAGAIEDIIYWEKCRSVIEELPGNCIVNVLNSVPYPEIWGLIQAHHLIVSPTRGENFGHAIYESLSLGRPVIISDQTPWKGLRDKQAGWDIPLSEGGLWEEKITGFANMSLEEFNTWCRGAWEYCRQYNEDSGIAGKYAEMFS
jgi:glycosyltransferase involved in cell wall biosynthesis